MLLALARLLSVVLTLEDGKVDGEIAWARATYPALANANFRTPALKVYAWVDTDGPIDVTVYTRDHDCMRARLARNEYFDDHLVATVRFPHEAPEVWPFDWVEKLELDGELIKNEPFDYGLTSRFRRPRYGVLSYADARVARFGGEAVPWREVATRDPLAKSRLDALLRHAVAWRPSSAPVSQIAALYRDPDDCRREHPPAPARGAKR